MDYLLLNIIDTRWDLPEFIDMNWSMMDWM